MKSRTGAFISVGAIGFGVQMGVLALLTGPLGLPDGPATAMSVESAVLTNFFWHERWTWADRPHERRAARLGRFHLANGATSIVGNVIVTLLAVNLLGLHVLAASALSVGILAVANFLLADRWVFAQRASVAGVVALVSSTGLAEASGPGPRTLDAWTDHVAAVERTLSAQENDAPLPEPRGSSARVDGGTIHDWRGSTVIRNTTVAAIVEGLTNPGTPPPQEDVVESRVLRRDGHALLVYLKLVRKVIITATYDTEHDVRFSVRSPTFATSRSVATRIVETGGEDRGFLWRLNSYWRYRQVGNDVQVDVLSLSLSRDLPTLLKPIARPIISRIGRESMLRTLDAVRRFGENRVRS